MPERQNSVGSDEGKRFGEWMVRKAAFHFDAKKPSIKEGEIWWCGVGENVGVEINGKSERFSRPVLVVKKYGKYSFLGVPLTSQAHEGSWYVGFRFLKKDSWAVLVQARTFSVSRLYDRLGTLPESDLELVRTRLIGLIR